MYVNCLWRREFFFADGIARNTRVSNASFQLGRMCFADYFFIRVWRYRGVIVVTAYLRRRGKSKRSRPLRDFSGAGPYGLVNINFSSIYDALKKKYIFSVSSFRWTRILSYYLSNTQYTIVYIIHLICI